MLMNIFSLVPTSVFMMIVLGFLLLMIPQGFWNSLSKFANSGSLVRSIILPRAHITIDYFLKRKNIRFTVGIALIVAGLLLFYYLR